MKDRDDVPEPSVVLERARDAVPITSRGLREFRRRLEGTADPAERARLERILATVRVTAPPTDRSAVAFGATVTVLDPAGRAQRYAIVGEDEVDIPNARIGLESPLTQALLGARVGDAVVWRRPAGDRALTVERIDY
jgi:transcription elongation GreA/GreB family factor